MKQFVSVENSISSSIINTLNLKKNWVKIQNCALWLDFLAFFCYIAHMTLFSRIRSAEWKVSDWNHTKFDYYA